MHFATAQSPLLVTGLDTLPLFDWVFDLGVVTEHINKTNTSKSLSVKAIGAIGVSSHVLHSTAATCDCNLQKLQFELDNCKIRKLSQVLSIKKSWTFLYTDGQSFVMN